jgi:hypothetical protein
MKHMAPGFLLNRPLGDGRVNFRRQADGFTQGGNDLAVVFQIVIGQGAATPVLEPLFANLITANVEIPDFGRDALEVLPSPRCATTPGFALPLLGEEGTNPDVSPVL